LAELMREWIWLVTYPWESEFWLVTYPWESGHSWPVWEHCCPIWRGLLVWGRLCWHQR